MRWEAGVGRFLRKLFLTLLVSAALAGVVLLLPIKPLLGTMQWIQTPVAVLIVVCGLGKLLYDTLFYDRYT